MAVQTCRLLIAANREELENHGTPMFPCARYFSDLERYATHEIPWHWHAEIELIIVKSGAMKLQLNNSTYILSKDEGAFINSNVLHTAFIHGNSGCKLNSFVFHPNLISGPIASIFEQRYMIPLTSCKQLFGIPFYPDTACHKQVLQCLDEAFAAFDSNEFGFELLLREKLSHLIFLIIKNSKALLETPTINKNQDVRRIKEMLNFIHPHFSQSINITQIAQSINLSERECLRCFQKTIGTTPIQYLLKYRISVAAQLLTTTDMPITMICDDTGFDSPSYFSKIFKRFMGCTPTFYRNSKK